MLKQFPRYDMAKPPMRQHLRLLIWLLSLPVLLLHRCKIVRQDMEGVRKGPFLLLCNHNAFMDFMVASHALRLRRTNFVVAIDGFIKREWLLRFIGCICTRKFTSDVTLVRHLKTVVSRGDVAAIYPEARYSLCGTEAVIPPSIGKLAKLLGVPVVTLVCHGHHVNSPFYCLPDHGVKGTRALMRCIATADEVAALSPAELTERIRSALWYDDFAWQRENHIRIKYKDRAKGLHKVLYQCPCCGREYRMASGGKDLWCTACGKRWELSEYGVLSAKEGETEFSHVPDWYEWERENVRRQVEAGAYRFSGTVRVDALPNAKGYIDLGDGQLTHDRDGFRLRGSYQGEEYEMHIPVPEMYSCHIEYDYLGKFGDCIDLNQGDNTMYLYPRGEDFSVTKFALATEELYDEWKKSRGRARS